MNLASSFNSRARKGRDICRPRCFVSPICCFNSRARKGRDLLLLRRHRSR